MQNLVKLENKQNLTAGEMEACMEDMVSGTLSDAEIIRFLTLLRDKKETPEEVQGAILALRKKSGNAPLQTARYHRHLRDRRGRKKNV